MLTCSNNNHDTRISQNYRMPTHQKRPPSTEIYPCSNGPYRSPSPNPRRRLATRRHSTPHLLAGLPSINPMLKDYHPEIKTVAPRNRSTPIFSRRRSRSLVKRFTPDEHYPLSSLNNEMIQPKTKKTLRSINETSVTSASEALLVTQDLSSKLTWQQRHRTRSYPLQDDGAISEDGTLSEHSCKNHLQEWPSRCDGTCIERLFNCNCCQCYYNCPFCCWLSCLVVALGLIIVICLIIGFYSF